jgi:hypothetical protein
LQLGGNNQWAQKNKGRRHLLPGLYSFALLQQEVEDEPVQLKTVALALNP